jgi:cell division protease FtsH
MSEKLGPLAFGKREEQIFLGREISQHKDYSESTAQDIDTEVRRIVTEAYERAKGLLTKHKSEVVLLAEALLEHESLSANEIDKILRGEKIVKKKNQAEHNTSSETGEEKNKAPDKDNTPEKNKKPATQIT